MIDATSDLTPLLLTENYNYWASRSPTLADDEHRRLARLLPTSHTFPYEIIGTPGARLNWSIWRDVLLDDCALLSEFERDRRRPERAGKLERHASAARNAKLFYFVFSYFGGHDGYYARTNTVDLPAFGVFIAPDSEKPWVSEARAPHATRRDLGSPQAGIDFEKLFLLPEDARELACKQIAQDPRHKMDFWHYWGSTKYWSEFGYKSDRWEWLFEFHFPNEIPLSKFAAILWPCELKKLESGGSALEYIGDGRAFRERHPTCHVIQYAWDTDDPYLCILSASEAAARHYIREGSFPSRV